MPTIDEKQERLNKMWRDRRKAGKMAGKAGFCSIGFIHKKKDSDSDCRTNILAKFPITKKAFNESTTYKNGLYLGAEK